MTPLTRKPEENGARSLIVDAQLFWDANTEALNKSIATLGSLPGYAQAYAETCRRTESVTEKLREAGCPSINAAIEYFDSHASPMLDLISEPVGRDAYLNVLIDRYYPGTYLNVLGIRPEFHARRFGGGFMSSTAPQFRHIEEVLDARLRFWYSEAFRKGGDVVLPSTPSMIREDLNDPGLVSRPVWARIKALDSEFRTRINQGVARDSVVCEALQKCFDILVEDRLDRDHDLDFQTLRRTIPDLLLRIAINLEWLPSAMAPDAIPWGHREWLMRLLDGRIAHAEASELGKPFGHQYPPPQIVVVPVPETDPLLQEIAIDEQLKALLAIEPKLISERAIRRGVEARGFSPDKPEFEYQVRLAVADLAKQYRGPVKIVRPSEVPERPDATEVSQQPSDHPKRDDAHSRDAAKAAKSLDDIRRSAFEFGQLHREFMALEDFGELLRADWKQLKPRSNQNGHSPAFWRICGNRFARVQFESIACKAADVYEPEKIPHSVEAWLDLLKQQGGCFVGGEDVTKTLPDGSEARYQTGRIRDLRALSARFCEQLSVQRSEVVWRSNREKLDSAIETLQAVNGFAAARSELCRVTEPILKELEATQPPRLKALDFFDGHAASMVVLVSNANTRDAFLLVLRDLYYADAHNYLIGGFPEECALKYGGGCVRNLHWSLQKFVQQLEERYGCWMREAFTRSVVPGQSEARLHNTGPSSQENLDEIDSASSTDKASATGPGSKPTPPRRKPDLELSSSRIKLVGTLARELVIVKEDLTRFCTASNLKAKHPDFELWKHLAESEIKELVEGMEFMPKAYAENLALRKFGVTSRETLRKDRQKLRKAGRNNLNY